MKTEILKALSELEKEKEIQILFAVESGSRAWGFPSPDSDYDVRFVYRHPLDWYLSLGKQQDVIEKDINEILDLSGWELKKSLELGLRSNVSLFEWLVTPICYREENGIRNRLLEVLEEYYGPRSSAYHYCSTARNTIKTHLVGVNIRIKKYFYILRPLLAALWLEKHETPPPMEFSSLLLELTSPGEVRDEINKLLLEKEDAEEKFMTPRRPRLDEFIYKNLAHMDEILPKLSQPRKDPRGLNDFFRGLIQN